MRATVVGSTIVHLALIAALFLWHGPVTHIVVPGPEAVQVALLDPSVLDAMVPAPAPAPARPTPPATAAKPAPERDAVRIEKPAVKPAAKPAPEVETPPPAPPPEAAPITPPAKPARVSLAYAPLGAAGMRGQVAVDTPNFEFAYYLMAVRNRIGQVWEPPAGLPAGGRPIEAVVYFRIGRDGTIEGMGLETPSGYEFFDRSAQRAVMLANPMPPLPLGFDGEALGVHFGFQYEAP